MSDVKITQKAAEDIKKALDSAYANSSIVNKFGNPSNTNSSRARLTMDESPRYMSEKSRTMIHYTTDLTSTSKKPRARHRDDDAD